MTISVIVPIYKVEAYLRQCVDSILAQTYTDLDIVLVDDGSTDNCPAICDAYARQDARVQVVHKPNGGLMSARQAGLRVAKGDYVGFVDGDDWIEPDMYARFAAAIDRYAPDMALCEFYYAFADHNEPSTQHLQRAYYTKVQLAQEIYPTMLYHAPYYSFGINPCCWSKVFKKELLEQCLYPVTPKVKIGEDAAFTYPCLLAAESLAYVDGCLYHYRNNAQSMTAAFDPHLTETIFIPLDILRTYFDTDKRALFAQYQMYAAYLLQLWVRNQASLDCDLDCIIQAYNYGSGFLDYAAKFNGVYSTELAEKFAEEQSGGNTVQYDNPMAVKENGGWRYAYGNMFYARLVKQYLIE